MPISVPNLKLLLLPIVLFMIGFPMSVAIALENPPLLFADPDDIAVVLTPTRLKQSTHDVPASVTVIDSETIKKLNIRIIADALRLVPGMAVATENNNIYRIEYHGTNGLIPRRMQVLIDGVSYYRSGMSVILWRELPVPIENIERIEVTRSPSAAAYGANSFFAVVNIITKHPIDTLTSRASSTVGSMRTKTGFLSVSEKIYDTTHYQFTFSHLQDEGFPNDHEGNERIDNTHINLFTFKTDTTLSSQSDLQISANAEFAHAQSDDGDERQLEFPTNNIEDYHFSALYTLNLASNHSLKVLGYFNRLQIERDWRTCYPTIFFSKELRAMNDANPAYAAALIANQTPSGGSSQDDVLAQAVLDLYMDLGAAAVAPTCGRISENYTEQPFGIELQDTIVLNQYTRAVSGFSITQKQVYSKTFLNGEVDRTNQQLFGNIEWSPYDVITFNVGGMYEKEDHYNSGFEFSPRAAANLHLNPHHTLRFVYAEAIRTPDLLEANRDWNYTMDFDSPLYDGRTTGLFYFNAKTSGSLMPEKIRAREISYYAEIPEFDVNWDLKVFREDLSELISEKLEFFNYHPSNNNSAILKGAEFQLEHRGKGPWSGYLSYAYLDNQATSSLEKTLYARHSGSVYVDYQFDNRWHSAMAYYGANAISGYSFDRFDIIVGKRFHPMHNATLDFTVKLQTYGNRESGVSDAQKSSNLLINDDLIFLSVEFAH